jgi:putative tricarboxylic transport membrane protein
LLLLAGIILCVAYVALFAALGFFVDTFLFLLAFILVGRYRRPGIALAVSGAGTLVFMFVFMKIVYVSLPIGAPPFSEVSILLMRLMGIR